MNTPAQPAAALPVNLTIEQHAEIFRAYLVRFSASDIRAIALADDDCRAAALNHGLNAQIEAGNKRLAVIESAMQRVLNSDREVITRIITRIISQ